MTSNTTGCNACERWGRTGGADAETPGWARTPGISARIIGARINGSCLLLAGAGAWLKVCASKETFDGFCYQLTCHLHSGVVLALGMLAAYRDVYLSYPRYGNTIICRDVGYSKHCSKSASQSVLVCELALLVVADLPINQCWYSVVLPVFALLLGV